MIFSERELVVKECFPGSPTILSVVMCLERSNDTLLNIPSAMLNEWINGRSSPPAVLMSSLVSPSELKPKI